MDEAQLGNISFEWATRVKEVLKQYRNAFALSADEVGHCNFSSFHLKLKDGVTEPIADKPRRVSFINEDWWRTT